MEQWVVRCTMNLMGDKSRTSIALMLVVFSYQKKVLESFFFF